MSENRAKGQDAAEAVLRRCLVEADEVALARARHRRRQTLVVSVGLQGVLLGALVLLPHLVTGERPILRRSFPIYSYGWQSPARRPANAGPAGPRQPESNRSEIRLIYRPPQVPSQVPAGETRQSDSNDLGPDILPLGNPDGPLPPGGIGERGWMPQISSKAFAPAEQEQRRLKHSEGVQQALLVHRVEPTYSPLARQMHLEGTVQLRAIIDREGRISSLDVLGGHPLLAHAALQAVSEWRYRPTLLNGDPVEVETYITIIFRLRR